MKKFVLFLLIVSNSTCFSLEASRSDYTFPSSEHHSGRLPQRLHNTEVRMGQVVAGVAEMKRTDEKRDEDIAKMKETGKKRDEDASRLALLIDSLAVDARIQAINMSALQAGLAQTQEALAQTRADLAQTQEALVRAQDDIHKVWDLVSLLRAQVQAMRQGTTGSASTDRFDSDRFAPDRFAIDQEVRTGLDRLRKTLH
jgi:chromosome segregation ATPase